MMTGVRSKQEKMITTIAHIVMIVLSLLAIIPFWLLVTSSLQDQSSIMADGYLLIPKNISMDTYTYLIKEGQQILRAYMVTIFTTVVGTTVSLILVSMTSYVLAIKDLPGGKFFLVMILLTMLINGGAVASYITYTNIFNIRNTIFALIIPNLLLNGFNVVLVRNYIKNSIPGELEEAAKIDGASLLSIYIKIILPLSKPILATVGLLTAIGYWNDWVNGLYYITESKYFSIQLLLNQINNSAQFFASNSDLKIPMSEVPTMGIRMAVSVLAIVPIVLAYPFFQKYFEAGITMGAVKG